MTDFGCAVVRARRSNTKTVHEVAGILRGLPDKTRIYLCQATMSAKVCTRAATRVSGRYPRASHTAVNRGRIALLVVLLVAALAGFGVFAAERRSDRASNTLRRELLDLGPVPSPRPVHARELIDDATAHTFEGLFDPTSTPRPDALLAATHAVRGGLPPGLEVGTLGVDSWRAVPAVSSALAERLRAPDATLPMCLDALAVGRDLARGGGTVGGSAALELSRAAFNSCAHVVATATTDQQTDAAAALTRILDGAPTLARAFREADLDAQVHLFGRWMRPQDLAELAPPIQAAAQAAQELPTGFIERQELLGVWSRMSKTTHAAMDALELPAVERDQTLELLEAKVDTQSVGLKTGWRAAIAHHEDRLILLRMLRLAAQLSLHQASAQQWPALSEVDSGDFSIAGEKGAAATLTTRCKRLPLSIALPWKDAS